MHVALAKKILHLFEKSMKNPQILGFSLILRGYRKQKYYKQLYFWLNLLSHICLFEPLWNSWHTNKKVWHTDRHNSSFICIDRKSLLFYIFSPITFVLLSHLLRPLALALVIFNNEKDWCVGVSSCSVTWHVSVGSVSVSRLAGPTSPRSWPGLCPFWWSSWEEN